MVDVLQILLIILVSVLMFALGSTLTVKDVRKVFTEKKRGLAIAAFSQFVFLPILGLALAKAFDVEDEVGLAVILVAATPGGSTSSLWSYYSRADVSLSLTATAISTVLALGLMPLNTYLWGSVVGDYDLGEDIEIDYGAMIGALFIVLVPVALGVLLRHKSEKGARIAEKVGSIIGAVFVVAAVVFGSVSESRMFEASWKQFVVGILLFGGGCVGGYFLSRFTKLGEPQARAITFETSVQNTSLCLAVITLSFPEGQTRDDVLVFPLLYSIFLVFFSALLTLWFRSRPIESSPDLLDGMDASTPKQAPPAGDDGEDLEEGGSKDVSSPAEVEMTVVDEDMAAAPEPAAPEPEPATAPAAPTPEPTVA